MTREREKLIRETWLRCRRDALEHFLRHPEWRAILLPLETAPLTADAPDLQAVEVISFRYEVAGLPHFGMWRVVCERLVVEGPYPDDWAAT